MKNDPVIVLITAPHLREGRKIARKLVEEKLAACVNLFPEVESVYRWEGKIENTKEVFLVVKTTRQKLKLVEKSVKACHSYAVPEIISIQIAGGLTSYLGWIADSVK